MSLLAYDPVNSILLVGGYRVTAFADGSFVNIEPVGEDFKAHHGAVGAAWVKQKNQGVKISFTLNGDSADNDVLSAKANLQKLVPSPAFETAFREIGGTTFVNAHRCRFTKMPKVERGTDMPKVEWEVVSLTADINVGSMA